MKRWVVLTVVWLGLLGGGVAQASFLPIPEAKHKIRHIGRDFSRGDHIYGCHHISTRHVHCTLWFRAGTVGGPLLRNYYWADVWPHKLWIHYSNP